MTSNKKPMKSGQSLAASEVMGLNSMCSQKHSDRITRLAGLKQRNKQQADYLFRELQNMSADEAQKTFKIADRLNDCSCYLIFRDYYQIETVKLHKKNSCKIPLLCPSCAAMRASKMIQRVVTRVELAMQANSRLIPVLITFTVRNGESLAERMEHLMKAFRVLQARSRDYDKKGRGYNEFCKIKGAFFSVEFTFNKKTGEWHPHIHMFALLDKYIDQDKLSELWHSVTKDSFIVDVRRVRRSKEHGLGKAVAEVCKYALKFADLSHEKAWEAYNVLKRKRLSGSFGCLWGIKEPDELTDDLAEENNLPYWNLHYSFVYQKKNSYYDLVKMEHVEPKNSEYRSKLPQFDTSASDCDCGTCELVFINPSG